MIPSSGWQPQALLEDDYSLLAYITAYLSVVSSETGERLTLPVHSSRHYALKIIQEPLNLFPEVLAGPFYARGMVD
ncbi:unnamed protein product [marine sediment metagenome]|uniref:Uncharacterized protein n=1 Tax=marine sediment metagenome TaxID=412755 RepID=X0XDE3_9ZZZZ